jgi:glucose-6-phosphate dehydrogenase assembly protein OpcA
MITLTNIQNELETQSKNLKVENSRAASLFNLIVFCHPDNTQEYYLKLTESLMAKYPCRVFFISEHLSGDLLETNVEIKTFPEGNRSVTCDFISFNVSPQHTHKVPYLILPHLTPDLPIYLLWLNNLTNPTIDSFLNLSTCTLLNSGNYKDLSIFSNLIKEKQKNTHCSFSDLNWLTIQPWKLSLARLFKRSDRLNSLKNTNLIEIEYSNIPLPFNSYPITPALYLMGWLSSRMNWTLVSGLEHTFIYDSPEGEKKIRLTPHAPYSNSPILRVKIKTLFNELFDLKTLKNEDFLLVNVHNENACEIPYKIPLPPHLSENTLWEELYQEKTSLHYTSLLSQFSNKRIGPCT